MLFKKIIDFFKSLFFIEEGKEIVDDIDETTLTQISGKIVAEEEQFKIENVIFEKLNYLEQYIKIFSLPFPEEYDMYFKQIKEQRDAYTYELHGYRKGFEGNITINMDPERQSKRLSEVSRLENEIEHFVNFVVYHKLYKDKFSKLCSKLNTFYNALIGTTCEKFKIIQQIQKAQDSLSVLVDEVKELEFFKEDAYKREEMFNYVIYGDYILFKSFIRCDVVNCISQYKEQKSKFSKLFVNSLYDGLLFKFIIHDLEQIQNFTTEHLQNDAMYEQVLKSGQDFERKLNTFAIVIDDTSYASGLIDLEDILFNLVKSKGVKISLTYPAFLNVIVVNDMEASVNSIAVSILNLVNNSKARILSKVISSFKTDISWRELYFLCRIFELYDSVMEFANNTIFNSVKNNFLKLEEEYKEYSQSYISNEKKRLLYYNGRRTKKYVLLLKVESSEVASIQSELTNLKLDFVVRFGTIYLNHAYFNGFKNLEANFGQEYIF